MILTLNPRGLHHMASKLGRTLMETVPTLALAREDPVAMEKVLERATVLWHLRIHSLDPRSASTVALAGLAS